MACPPRPVSARRPRMRGGPLASGMELAACTPPKQTSTSASIPAAPMPASPQSSPSSTCPRTTLTALGGGPRTSRSDRCRSAWRTRRARRPPRGGGCGGGDQRRWWVRGRGGPPRFGRAPDASGSPPKLPCRGFGAAGTGCKSVNAPVASPRGAGECWISDPRPAGGSRRRSEDRTRRERVSGRCSRSCCCTGARPCPSIASSISCGASGRPPPRSRPCRCTCRTCAGRSSTDVVVSSRGGYALIVDAERSRRAALRAARRRGSRRARRWRSGSRGRAPARCARDLARAGARRSRL